MGVPEKDTVTGASPAAGVTRAAATSWALTAMVRLFAVPVAPLASVTVRCTP